MKPQARIGLVSRNINDDGFLDFHSRRFHFDHSRRPEEPGRRNVVTKLVRLKAYAANRSREMSVAHFIQVRTQRAHNDFLANVAAHKTTSVVEPSSKCQKYFFAPLRIFDQALHLNGKGAHGFLDS